MNLQELCIELATTEDGNDVVQILKNHNIWDNEDEWLNVGSHEDKNSVNASVIGAQQSNPANALAEKLINSGDSALMVACAEKGIDPKGKDAPKNVSDAIKDLFDVDYGRWINSSKQKRTSLGTQYCSLVATGMTGTGKEVCPTYAVIDRAEGQAPERFRDTFLSLTRNNKMEVPFVQGKFGMGSYGAVNFCTVEGIQLIISKRNPIVQDGLSTSWGFTVIRKIKPVGSYRSSRWMYMTINGEIPCFDAAFLNIAPGKYPNPYGEKFEFGTFVKMYNYDIGPSLRTHAHLDLNYKLNTLLVNPLVPVRIFERRNFAVEPKSPEATLDGLETRLDRNREGVVADGFPSDLQINVENQIIPVKLYVLNRYNSSGKEIKTKTYGNGVLFCLNGQATGSLSTRFFNQGKLKYRNISNNILVLVDCSNLENEFIEDMFKSDRERIADRSFTLQIKEQLQELLSSHTGLRKFQSDWKKDQILKVREDNKELNEIMSSLISKHPDLAKVLDVGFNLSNPFKKEGKQEPNIFESEYYPTFFRLAKEHPKDKPRNAERERDVRINFQTDAPNDYFFRPKDPGNIKVIFNNEIINDIKFMGFDGKWSLYLPERTEDIQHYSYIIEDVSKINDPFKGDFYLKLIDKKEKPKKQKKPTANSKSLKIPKAEIIKRDDFSKVGFDDYDALMIEEYQDGQVLYNLNLDNIHLINYCKKVNNQEVDVVKEQYEVSMMLVGMMLRHHHKELSLSGQDSDQTDLSEFSKTYTRCIAPIMLNLVRDIATMFD